ncbi:hypothetical protein [Nitrosopumilus sp. Nsub]|uniref:hypothetical protein n=1 Tax=Nitrosopumilus sp. Nsub TaxID=1776294 RepID=UPI000832A41C|nr:hypothetical protein [Nitrosopumilus sp. Nsub]
MKKILIFTIFLTFIAFSTYQITFAEIEDGEQAAKDAANSLKRGEENTIESEYNTNNDFEKKEIKKKLSKLKKFLPTEEELDKITLRTVWRYVDKQSDKNEEFEIERIQALIRDIGRVYDPVVNKYKVATIQIEIIKFNDDEKVKDFWMIDKKSDLGNLYDNAYLIGTPSDGTECIFNYSNVGAMTICKTDEFIIQSIIFDKYQEHYTYSKPQTGIKKLTINQDEMTTQVVENILKKIKKSEIIEFKNELYKILESNIEIKQKQQLDAIKQNEKNNEVNKKNKLLDVEKDKKYGIQNFSCLKDEFGLITISGQYNNDQIKKDKVNMEILFLDYDEKVIFKNTAQLLEIDEFETKRFLGNLKIDERFSTCTIKTRN